MDADLVGRFEAGLVAAWARQGGWVPVAAWHRLGGLVVALSGVPDQSQQVALVESEPDDPAAAVLAAEVLFTRRGWTPGFDLLAGAHPRLEAALTGRGYRVVASRPGLVRRLDPLASVGTAPSVDPGLAAVVVRPARPDDLTAVRALQAASFDLTPAVADGMLAPGILTTPGAALLVAEEGGAGGTVIGSVLVHLDQPTAGIVGLAVAPVARRRGVGTALTHDALDRAARAGADLVWLQSTPMAEPLYRSAGFVELGRCEVWLLS